MPATAWLCLGVLLVLGPVLWQVAWPAAMGAVAIGLTLAWLSHPRALGYALFLPLGALLTLLHVWAPWNSYVRQMPRRECCAGIRGVVVSPVYQGDFLPWLAAGRLVSVALSEVAFDARSVWTRSRGTVLLRLPTDSTSVRYGDTIQALGAFTLPGTALFAGDFDYRRHIFCSGYRHVFLADHFRVRGSVRGWRRGLAGLYALRDRAAELLVRGVRDDANARLLPPMVLGYRHGLDTETRTRFLRSGTIHLFAISGLNVAIFAGFCLGLLRLVRVPFRARYLLLPPVLLAYAVMTGGEASALRAWVMGSVWATAKGLLLPAVAVNTVAVAAFLLLLANPLYLAQVGFQFSFLIVLALVLGWHPVTLLIRVLDERRLWCPARLQTHSWFHVWRRSSVQLAAGSVLAWTAAAGLVAWTNCLMIPGGVIVNAGVSFFGWLVLVLAAAKIGFAVCPLCQVPETLIARLFDLTLNLTQGIVECGSRAPASLIVSRPPLGVVLAYYACLGLYLAPGAGRRWRLGAGLGLGGLLLAMTVAPWPPGRQAAVFSPVGSGPPGIALLRPPPLGAIVVDPANADMSRRMVTWLTQHGCAEIDLLLLTEERSWREPQVLELSKALTVRTVAGPAPRHPRDLSDRQATGSTAAGTRYRECEPRVPDRRQEGYLYEGHGVVATWGGAAKARNLSISCLSPQPGWHLTVEAQALTGAWVRFTSGRGADTRRLVPISMFPKVSEL